MWPCLQAVLVALIFGMPRSWSRAASASGAAAYARSRLARTRSAAVMPSQTDVSAPGRLRLHSAQGSRSWQERQAQIAAWRSSWSSLVYQFWFTPGDLHLPANKSGGGAGWGHMGGLPARQIGLGGHCSASGTSWSRALPGHQRCAVKINPAGAWRPPAP